mmetsp:Transcript_4334/g.10605  ORF Transcript_4334/g.10605 Transcript_4334/m.10605 type:complete len:405 (-) Transcript_4334:166-1380(-)
MDACSLQNELVLCALVPQHAFAQAKHGCTVYFPSFRGILGSSLTELTLYHVGFSAAAAVELKKLNLAHPLLQSSLRVRVGLERSARIVPAKQIQVFLEAKPKSLLLASKAEEVRPFRHVVTSTQLPCRVGAEETEIRGHVRRAEHMKGRGEVKQEAVAAAKETIARLQRRVDIRTEYLALVCRGEEQRRASVVRHVVDEAIHGQPVRRARVDAPPFARLDRRPNRESQQPRRRWLQQMLRIRGGVQQRLLHRTHCVAHAHVGARRLESGGPPRRRRTSDGAEELQHEGGLHQPERGQLLVGPRQPGVDGQALRPQQGVCSRPLERRRALGRWCVAEAGAGEGMNEKLAHRHGIERLPAGGGVELREGADPLGPARLAAAGDDCHEAPPLRQLVEAKLRIGHCVE